MTDSGSELTVALGNLSINNGAEVNVTSGGSVGSTSSALFIGTNIDGGALNVQGNGSTASAASVTVGHGGSGGLGVLTVGTTDSGAEFTTGTGTTTILETGDAYVGSGSTTGTFNANGDVLLDAGRLHIREMGSFNLAAGKKLTAQNFGAISFKNTGYSAPADTDYELSSGGEIFVEGDLEFGTAGNNTITLDGGFVTSEATITIGPDAQVTGQGNVDSPNSPLTPTIVQGSVIGTSPSERITLGGYVTGTGTLDNVLIDGTHAPGMSTAAVNVGDVFYSDTSTLEIELGGTGAGEFDQVNSSNSIELESSMVTLNVSLFGGYTPVEGHSFDILTAVGGITGQFTPPSLPALGGDLEWFLLYDTNVVSLFVTLPGDFNGDGVTDAADYTVWRDTLGDFVAKGSGADADFDGEITENDYTLWRENFGATAPPPGSGSAASAKVPEPASWALLIFGCIAIFARYEPNFLAPTK